MSRANFCLGVFLRAGFGRLRAGFGCLRMWVIKCGSSSRHNLSHQALSDVAGATATSCHATYFRCGSATATSCHATYFRCGSATATPVAGAAATLMARATATHNNCNCHTLPLHEQCCHHTPKTAPNHPDFPSRVLLTFYFLKFLVLSLHLNV